MKFDEDSVLEIDERTERLICRLLDGEITADERAELADVLARDAVARALLKDYSEIDAKAADALRHDLSRAVTAVAPRGRRGLWLATAGGLVAAAAVFVFSFLPDLWTGGFWPGGGGVPMGAKDSGDAVVRGGNGFDQQSTPGFPGLSQARRGQMAQQFVDYGGLDQRPAQRSRDLQRDWVGIPTADPNTIIIIQRDRRTTRITPISGDF
jgi:hypothetical protein